MNDPKTIFQLRWQDYGTPIAAGTTEVAADQDVDDITGYAGATKSAVNYLTGADKTSVIPALT